MIINTTISPSEIIKVFQNKELDIEWTFDGLKPSETGKWTHNYHRYPAKFIPQLVEKLIEEYLFDEKKAHINDPFMGCGTTIVTAISEGFYASGTDINRIAYLITKVKSTPIEPFYLRRKLDNFLKNVSLALDDNSFFSKEIEPLVPSRFFNKINYWFPENNVIKLGKILRIIFYEKDVRIRDFLLVAFSHILKSCSYWLTGSTKPTRNLNKKPSDPYDAIRKHLRKMEKGNEAFYSIIPPYLVDRVEEYLNIKIDDAKRQPVRSDTVDLIITSSPYVTSYEYADIHQLSTIWLDLVDDLYEYKKEFIGTSLKKYEGKNLSSEIGKNLIEKMYLKSISTAKEIEAFFIDMEDVFRESYRILKRGGKACYVIGNTKLKGIEILNAEVFTELMQEVGFNIHRIIKRKIPNKILPQKRDEKTGKFAKNNLANSEAYPFEYIIIGSKE